MRLDTNAASVSAGITGTIFSALCALLVALFPELAIKLLGYIIHSKIEISTQPINLLRVIIGLIVVFVLCYVSTWIWVKMYNKIAKQD